MKISGLILQAETAVGKGRPLTRSGWPEMTTGRVLAARVVALEPAGLLSLDIDGRIVAARSDLKLSVGDELLLKVKDSGPPPVLVPVPPNEKAASGLFSRLLTLIDQNNPQEFARAASLALSAEGEASLPAFSSRPEIVSLLRVVAGLLPRWVASADRGLIAVREGHERLKESERGEIINLMQRFNDIPPERNICCCFPLIFDEEQGYGAWFLKQEEAPGAGAAAETVAEFFLLLSALGEVRARVGFSPARVRAAIWLSSDAARQHMRKGLSGLKTRLARAAGRTVEITVRSDPPAIRAELARVLSSGGENPLLDTRV